MNCCLQIKIYAADECMNWRILAPELPPGVVWHCGMLVRVCQALELAKVEQISIDDYIVFVELESKYLGGKSKKLQHVVFKQMTERGWTRYDTLPGCKSKPHK